MGRRRDIEVVELVHDLRGPLMTIALEMSVLAERRADPVLERAVARVTQNVTFLERMIENLLDASAPDASAFCIGCHDADLRPLLERVVDRTVASRDRARVIVEASESIYVTVDDLRIERVIANLLHNALKFSPPGSPVIIRLDRREGCALVSVTDRGPGIPVDDVNRVFDSYTRLGSAHAHEGSGLGLYVSKRIIDAHGGDIGVTSVDGEGACFYFRLPLAAHARSQRRQFRSV